DELISGLRGTRPYDRADDRVQPRAIAAAGENSDSHEVPFRICSSAQSAPPAACCLPAGAMSARNTSAIHARAPSAGVTAQPTLMIAAIARQPNAGTRNSRNISWI